MVYKVARCYMTDDTLRDLMFFCVLVVLTVAVMQHYLQLHG